MGKRFSLILFDADGTLVTTQSGATFRHGADDWQWLPGRIEKLRQLKEQGVRLAVCTNQGGVAFGFMRQEEILAELQRMCREAGIPAGGLYACYTHPGERALPQYRMVDHRRKPGPGMLYEAIQDFGIEHKDEVLYVGDMEDDRKAAEHAGVNFQWANEFFK